MVFYRISRFFVSRASTTHGEKRNDPRPDASSIECETPRLHTRHEYGREGGAAGARAIEFGGFPPDFKHVITNGLCDARRQNASFLALAFNARTRE